MLGNFFGGMLSFFKPMKIALSAIDDEERVLRDDSDTAKEKFIAEISRSLPGVIRLSNAPKKIDPITEKPVLQPWPLGRAVGLNFVHPSFLSNKDTPATQWANRLFPFVGSDGKMSAEEKNIYYIRKRLKEAVRKGTLSKDEANERAKKYLSGISPQSMGRLKDELKLSELAVKVKYSFGTTGKDAAKDLRALRIVWDKASESEKDDLRAVLKKKEHLTKEFKEEFGLRSSPK